MRGHTGHMTEIVTQGEYFNMKSIDNKVYVLKGLP
jgi:hypothetical protein